MEIDNKYREVIIKSLKYSIYHIREYHQNMIAKTIDSKNKWEYDYEKNSIEPIQEALTAIKNTKKR